MYYNKIALHSEGLFYYNTNELGILIAIKKITKNFNYETFKNSFNLSFCICIICMCDNEKKY